MCVCPVHTHTHTHTQTNRQTDRQTDKTWQNGVFSWLIRVRQSDWRWHFTLIPAPIGCRILESLLWNCTGIALKLLCQLRWTPLVYAFSCRVISDWISMGFGLIFEWRIGGKVVQWRPVCIWGASPTTRKKSQAMTSE